MTVNPKDDDAHELLPSPTGTEQPFNIDEEEPFSYVVQLQKIDIATKKSFLKNREQLGTMVFLLVCLWLIAILSIVIFKGLHIIPLTGSGFDISDGITITLITTTTINVIAFLTVIVKDHFPNQKAINLNLPESVENRAPPLKRELDG